MNALTREYFQQWMETYGRASAENDPQASANLFAQDARYYESPFDEPMVGRDAIYEYWSKGAQTLKEKAASFEILAVNGDTGIARWQSKFTVIESGKRLALDCLFVVEFNNDGLCQTFREWWHIQENLVA
ncbi:MAG: nuclear transport factor 2 family protein [Caldilineaceae bacterium]|nr:nuclear transport factor 2 family protein [Caldilineaceae bacterium]